VGLKKGKIWEKGKAQRLSTTSVDMRKNEKQKGQGKTGHEKRGFSKQGVNAAGEERKTPSFNRRTDDLGGD